MELGTVSRVAHFQQEVDMAAKKKAKAKKATKKKAKKK
jgi:hypothetical protein